MGLQKVAFNFMVERGEKLAKSLLCSKQQKAITNIKGLEYGFHNSKAITSQGTNKLNSIKKYTLLEKTEKPISDFKFPAPENAVTYRTVIIGKPTDPDYYRKIVSFYSKNGYIIEQRQSGTGIQGFRRIYKHYKLVEKPEYKITRIDTISNKHNKPISHECRYVDSQKIEMEGKGIVDVKKLHITKNIYSENGFGRNITLTEYPTTHGLEPKSAKKEMKIELNYSSAHDIPSVISLSGSSNIQLPKDDKFLKFRFLSGEEKQEGLARHYLNEKGLKDASVSVYTQEKGVLRDGTNACFDAENGVIYFNEIVDRPVRTAAHEVEHAWQHLLIGRLAPSTDYEKKCLKLYGPLKTQDLQQEAQKLAQANKEYKEATISSEGKINKEYLNNYLEVKAREAGKKAQNEYNIGRAFILNQFKLILKADA